ncbi:hypothetical protein [Embleya sp. NBC_00896]|uniref:hypothetical protein n=1 Tax=Embleya sp. NBC_00896 TaxID=2975961 RepID=UPI0038688FFF|nr:septum formation family protein [Embleya sp. NBC_00896]
MLLTGCLGEDKEPKASGTVTTPGASTGSADPASGPPTSPSTAQAPGAGTPSAASSLKTIKMITLVTGDCINQNGDEIDKVPCTVPHRAQVVGEFTLPETMSPTTLTFRDDVLKKCTELSTPALDRNEGIEFTQQMFRPTPDSWLNQKDRALDCLLRRTDDAPLTAPLK